jgi:hypothetical protein
MSLRGAHIEDTETQQGGHDMTRKITNKQITALTAAGVCFTRAGFSVTVFAPKFGEAFDGMDARDINHDATAAQVAKAREIIGDCRVVWAQWGGAMISRAQA